MEFIFGFIVAIVVIIGIDIFNNIVEELWTKKEER